MTFGPGSIVAGRYHADRLVGTGGMGEVWAGEHVTAGNKVALKRLLPAAAQHPEVVTRFRREAVLLGRIRSDYVARVVDFIEDQQFGAVLVMEFIEGPSLAQILEDRAISVEEAVELASDLAAALCDLHDAKIVHRDLKPGNIIMQPQRSGRSRAVIVDFGIGRQLATKGAPEEVTGITRANIALGTVEYMAPEQILNSKDVTPLSDIYAVGAILYRSVAGVHAFGSRRGEELARAKLIDEAPRLNVGRTDEVGRGLSDLVARALKKRPAQRFSSAAELRQAVGVIYERMQIDELDLESTTAETRLFPLAKEPPPPTPLLPVEAPARPRPPQPNRARAPHFEERARAQPDETARASFPSIADQRVSMPAITDQSMRASRPSISDAGQSVRHSVPSIGDGTPNMRGSMPSIGEGTANMRSSMPSISDGNQNARSSMPSIPDSRQSVPGMPGGHRGSLPSISEGFGNDASGVISPRPPMGSMAGAPDSIPRSINVGSIPPGAGVGKKTVGLAVLTAFSVGAALGLVLAPSAAPPTSAAASTASAACSCPAPPASAPPSQAPPTGSIARADAPIVSATPSSSAAAGATSSAPSATLPSAPKPVLTGKLPDSKWVPPTSGPTGDDLQPKRTDGSSRTPPGSSTVDMGGI